MLCAASCQSRSTATYAESYHCIPVLLTPMTFITTRQLHPPCELYLRSPALRDERRTDTFDIILFHAHTPVTDYIVRVYSAHGRLVFLCKLRCCVTDIPYAFVHRTHLIHRSFVRRLALVYVLLSNSDHIFPLPLEDEDVFILKSPLHSTERLSQLR